jgi:dipeptidyl aminopeptidase/acylaminoacyl peptidase
VRTPPLPAVLLGAALLTAGCSSAVAGTAEPRSAGPLTEALAAVEADAGIEGHVRLADVAATADGRFVALLTGDVGANHRSVLVELVPQDGGLGTGTVTEGPAFADIGEVHVADDGTVVALAPVLPEDRRSGGGAAVREQDLAMAVLAPGAEEPDLVRIAADPVLGTPDLGTGVLSPDGATLYAALRYWGDGRSVDRLAEVDVVTGEVRATGELQVPSPGETRVADLALRPDGGLAALVSTDRDAEGESDGVVLARYDAGLRPLGAPVELVEEEESTGYALHVLADGTVVVSLLAGDLDTGEGRLVTVRDGAVAATAVLPGLGVDLAVGPGEELAYLSHGRPGTAPAVVTVDLATGETVAQVALCADGYPAGLALDADGRAVLAGAVCTEGRSVRDLVTLVG